MSPEEWQEIVEETEKRWPDDWTPEQAVAYYQDLKDFDVIDVWAAWHKLNATGLYKAPQGSMLLSGTIQERRESAQRDRWNRPKLEPGEEQTITWTIYSTEVYGMPVGFKEAIRLEHAKIPASLCAGLRRAKPYCDVHHG